jgi:hypothetical protein
LPGENSVEPRGAGDAGGRDFGELVGGVLGVPELVVALCVARDDGLASRIGTAARAGFVGFAIACAGRCV